MQNTMPLFEEFSIGSVEYFEPTLGRKVVKVPEGEFFITNRDDYIVDTQAESSVVITMHDPRSGITAVGNFEADDRRELNEMLDHISNASGKDLGGFKTKLFGASATTNSKKSAVKLLEMVQGIIDENNLNVITSDIGENFTRRIHVFTDRGNVMLKRTSN
jgi:chemotaxis receptor (MCP) glutamine deamidase CheD